VDELKGSETEKNLLIAFAGESQANRKYLAFAKQADKEGYKQVGKLFRAVAEAETIHAHAHLKVLGGVKSTRENLNDAASGEKYEFTEMYPAMIDQSRKDGSKAAERAFRYANEVEKIHASLYKNALDNLESSVETDYYVCSVCGYTCEMEPPDKCPVCGAKSTAFFKID
jgi:rubrerythrin